jgi:hypothetical protein
VRATINGNRENIAADDDGRIRLTVSATADVTLEFAAP